MGSGRRVDRVGGRVEKGGRVAWGQASEPQGSDVFLPQARSPLLPHRPWSPVRPSKSHRQHPPQPGAAAVCTPCAPRMHPTPPASVGCSADR
jgi:hypothetical protein